MKGPAATRVDWDCSEDGIGCLDVPWALATVDPVVVLSANILLPIDEHPESAVAAARMPTRATTLSALCETRLLISPLVRMYSMDLRLGA
jgi:hypothetical protein